MTEVVNYVLIDLENIQPKNLHMLSGHGFRVLVFVGENQKKISLEFASAIQSLGADSEYIQINGHGPNALDFHIAFYIGKLSQRDESNYFHIISNDQGFDPLMAHLRSKNIRAQRHQDITDIPLIKIMNSNSKTERIDAIVESLIARGAAKPRKVKTLSNSINSWFLRALSEDEIADLIDELVERKLISISDQNNVSYRLTS